MVVPGAISELYEPQRWTANKLVLVNCFSNPCSKENSFYIYTSNLQKDLPITVHAKEKKGIQINFTKSLLK